MLSSFKAKIKPLLKMTGCYCPCCGVKKIMNLNKKIYEKLCMILTKISNRLMQADFHDYNSILKSF